MPSPSFNLNAGITNAQPKTPVRFGNAAATPVIPQVQTTYAVKPNTVKLSNLFTRFFEWVGTVASPDKLQKAGFIGRRLRRFGAMVFDFDTRKIHYVKNMAIVEPSIGTIILLLYPFTIAPRLYRAIKRDPSGTEAKDVLRRDLTAISIFLFMLPPLVNLSNTLKEKRDKLKLVSRDKTSLLGKVFSYTQFENNYRITSPAVLEALVATGNGEGLRRAAERIFKDYKTALADIEGSQTVLKQIRDYQDKIDQMLLEPAGSPKIKGLAEEAFKKLGRAQEIYDTQFEKLAKLNAPANRKLLSQFSKTDTLLPRLTDMVGHYAKMKRLPIDIASFITVVSLIGWFPVWLNSQLSKKRVNPPAALPNSAPVSPAFQNPQAMFDALKQSSRLRLQS